MDLSKIKIIYLHGNNCRVWWYPLFARDLKKELLKLGFNKKNLIFQTLPDRILARKKYWFEFLKSKHCDENTILIGRSSGAICAMRWAEIHKIFGTVLISPYYTDLNYKTEKESGYFNDIWNFKMIKNNNLNFIIQVNSLDDHIPQREFQIINRELKINDSDHIIFKKGKHFSTKTKFPQIILKLKEKLNIK